MTERSRFERTEDTTLRAQELRTEVSKTEGRLWPKLCKGRMGASFRKQHPIGPYFADYCCVSLKLIIEVDGPHHEKSKDDVRDSFLTSRGYDVLRFPAQDMDKHFKDVVETIYANVQLRLQAKAVADPEK